MSVGDIAIVGVAITLMGVYSVMMGGIERTTRPATLFVVLVFIKRSEFPSLKWLGKPLLNDFWFSSLTFMLVLSIISMVRHAG